MRITHRGDATYKYDGDAADAADTIRRFNRRDLKRILEIESKSFPKSPYNRLTFLYFSRLYPDSFLVYDRGKILAYIIFDPRDGHIASIAVDPLYRKQGIGTVLMKEVFKRCGGGWVEVRQKNKDAQEFYRHLGFVRSGVIKNYYGSEDAWVMVKD